MKKITLLAAIAVILFGIREVCAAPSVKREDYFITVLTGPSSGMYFPIGGAFAAFIKNLGYGSSVAATGASVENLTALLTHQGELAIVMADTAIQAVEAFGAYEGKPPAKSLRAMMGLWPNYCQIVTMANTGIKKFTDLKGRRVGVGAPNSGVEINARMIFEAHGMTYDDCTVDYLDYGEAINQMRNNHCDVAFVTSGLGNAMIRELGATREIVFIPVEGEPLEKLIEKYPFYIQAKIPADTYETKSATTTTAVMNIMLVDVELPGEVVYDLLENIYSPAGMEAIHAAHAAAKENISLDTALRGILGTNIPLHDGALQFYKDKGLLE
ncbi:MAG: TAXI family TRAP transporter solute-binding subunit [Synergistaceae bacterium]|jgi:TRAP transporter TAXI family solute receptor|nr:TAXI family TRAP transporter solute-binding subunit [Synergistaceae bacterium]